MSEGSVKKYLDIFYLSGCFWVRAAFLLLWITWVSGRGGCGRVFLRLIKNQYSTLGFEDIIIRGLHELNYWEAIITRKLEGDYPFVLQEQRVKDCAGQ